MNVCRTVHLARDYSMKRVCFGKPIKDHKLHVKSLANMEVQQKLQCHFDINRMCRKVKRNKLVTYLLTSKNGSLETVSTCCHSCWQLSLIRPILEYVAPVWHHLLTKSHTDQIEAIQKGALNIIYIDTHGILYASSLFLAGLATLAERREKLSRKFFDSVEDPDPAYITSSLRSCTSLVCSPVFLTEPKNVSPSYPMLSASIIPAKF